MKNTEYTKELGHIYKPGTLAFIDSFAGLVPCKVVAVAKGGPFPGWLAAGESAVTIKPTVSRGGYRKGETIQQTAAQVVPRSQVVTRSGKFKVRTCYSWAD